MVLCLRGSAEGDKPLQLTLARKMTSPLTYDSTRNWVTSQNNKDGRNRKQQLLGRYVGKNGVDLQ